jgi:D-sedoheptulose 7-phosphate isomerase
MDSVKNSLIQAKEVLEAFIAGENNMEAIAAAASLMVDALKNKGKIISFGNGGSMCDAMHFAEELTGRFRDDRPAIPALAISDPSHITCTANDYGFQAIFSRYIEALGNPGDIAFAISTSGNSENILLAAQSAKTKGMKVIALTGKTGGKLAAIADVEIRVPFMGYSDRIQEVHIKIIHILIELIEKNYKA